jgi:hypothetical protein
MLIADNLGNWLREQSPQPVIFPETCAATISNLELATTQEKVFNFQQSLPEMRVPISISSLP